jgi:hypothetical protein
MSGFVSRLYKFVQSGQSAEEAVSFYKRALEHDVIVLSPAMCRTEMDWLHAKRIAEDAIEAMEREAAAESNIVRMAQ